MTLTDQRVVLAALILPRCDAGEPDTACAVCGGMLAYLRGGWRHTDHCVECFADPPDAPRCREEHLSCDAPEPVTCTHEVERGCHEPAALTVTCALARAPRTCCGCCWEDHPC